MSAQIQIATVLGRRFAFLQGGDADGTQVIVLVHAFPVGVRLLEPQIEAFPGWRVIAPALPGFDGSDLLDDTSIDRHALHVLALLDALGIDRAVFGGVSLGGHLTFAVLRQAAARVSGVVLADTRSAADSPEALAGRRQLLQTAEQSGASAVADQMVPKLLGQTTQQRRPEVVARVRQMIESQTAKGIADAIRVLMSRPDSTPLLGGIRVPALVVVGEEDALTPPAEMEQMAAAIPRATFARIAGSGHLANLENAQAFNVAVSEFLRDLNWPVEI